MGELGGSTEHKLRAAAALRVAETELQIVAFDAARAEQRVWHLLVAVVRALAEMLERERDVGRG